MPRRGGGSEMSVLFCFINTDAKSQGAAVTKRYDGITSVRVKVEGIHRESPRCAPGTLLIQCRLHKTKKHTVACMFITVGPMKKL